MDIQRIHEMGHAFAAATIIDELTALCRDGSQRLGFHSFIYVIGVPTHFADAKLIMLDGYPEGWVKRYFEKAHFEADPVMAYCANHIVPVQWCDLPLTKGSREEAVMLDAAEFGLRAGITVPVHSPNGELGILSLAFAQILGISEGTVNFHLNNAMQKLDVISRQHAIGKAALQGLIQPKPF
jgi:hypothetical protein